MGSWLTPGAGRAPAGDLPDNLRPPPLSPGAAPGVFGTPTTYAASSHSRVEGIIHWAISHGMCSFTVWLLISDCTGHGEPGCSLGPTREFSNHSIREVEEPGRAGFLSRPACNRCASTVSHLRAASSPHQRKSLAPRQRPPKPVPPSPGAGRQAIRS